MRAHRVFIDTNILLSGLVFGRNETALLRLAADKCIRLVLSEPVLREARGVISRKFPEVAGELDKLLQEVEWEKASRPSPKAVLSSAALVRDPDDAEILASILVTKPDYAITGDKDLLTEDVKAVAPMSRCADYLREHWPDLIPKADN